MGQSAHRTTLSCTLYRAGLHGRVVRKKKHKKIHLVFAKQHKENFPNKWMKLLWPKPVDIWETLCVAQTQHFPSHSHSEAWWWLHFAVEMLFNGKGWKTGQDWKDGWHEWQGNSWGKCVSVCLGFKTGTEDSPLHQDNNPKDMLMIDWSGLNGNI